MQAELNIEVDDEGYVVDEKGERVLTSEGGKFLTLDENKLPVDEEGNPFDKEGNPVELNED